MRAREPDLTGYVDRDDVRIYYEVYGDGPDPIVFTPADTIVDARMWKAQVAPLARHHRVVVIDPRGNGHSDRPVGPELYTDLIAVGDLLAVMDAVGIERAVLVGLCDSAWYGLLAAARHPARVQGVVAIAPSAVEGTPSHDRGIDTDAIWTADLVAPRGWELYNQGVWRRDWPSYARWFFSQICNDPHSSKIYEDVVEWASQTDGEVMISLHNADFVGDDRAAVAATLAAIRCPVLVVQGTHDACEPFARGVHIARMAGAELLVLGGAGHLPQARHPVVVNHAIAEFVARVSRGLATRHDEPIPIRIRPDALHGSVQDRIRPEVGTYDDGGGGRVRWRVYARSRQTEGSTVLLLTPPDLAESVREEMCLRLMRHARVVAVTCDGSPRGGDGVGEQIRAALRALDETASARAVLVAVAQCNEAALHLATHHPERVSAWLALAPRSVRTVGASQSSTWLRDLPGVTALFFDQYRPDASADRLIEDLVGERERGGDRVVQCPVIVVQSAPAGAILRADESALVELAGAVVVAVEDTASAPRTRSRRRRRRALYLSSPIGLGHVRRDLAIADELRAQHSDVDVEWLTQSPVTDFLEQRGEVVHPASGWLASESSHIEAEAGEHDLHAFQAIRRMDEILVANFMVFDELVRDRHYDLWIGDEAWDLDRFLHENPGLKRAPFAWLTDFVGWVPMPDGGGEEAFLTSDYNAEMVEQVARCPGLRDRSVFVGDPEDLVGHPLGPGLPTIEDWTKEHFEFSGYVMGERPDQSDRHGLRARLGYGQDDVLCVASVGGSRVGAPLLRRIIEAYDAAVSAVPELRLQVVTGPRLDPADFPAPDGVVVHGFLPDLDLHHAACDVAIVQGGLSTTMELTASRRPFLYFPLGHHFEQQVHVRHRLDRHRAGRAMDYATAGPDEIARALVAELGRETDYVPVPTDGAARAAQLVGELL